MSQSANKLIKRKRLRNPSLKYWENYTHKEFIIKKENSRYFFNLSIEEELNRILIRCGPSNASLKFEINLDLELLKQKYKMFNACYTLEEAFKAISNLFKNKKVNIQEENNDSIILVLSLVNYIDDKEEEAYLNLVKNKINVRADLNELGENKKRNVIIKDYKENNKNNLDSDFDQKIVTLYRKDQAKENQLQRLEKNLQEIKDVHYSLKKELNFIKRNIGYNKINVQEEVEDNNNINVLDQEDEKEEENEYMDNEENNKSMENEDNNYDENDLIQKEKAKKQKKMEKSKLKVIKIKEIKNRPDDYKSKYIPKMVFAKNLTKKAICRYLGDNNFAVFKTINKEIFLAYGTPYNSIHFYNIELERVTKRITNAHDFEITNFRYSFDKNYNRDLLLTVSNQIKNIKIWDIQNLNCIVGINNAYTSGNLFSSCFLIDENYKRNYIITINYDKENLKIFDFEGKNIREINNSDDKSFLVDTYYNSRNKKYYIVVGNEKFIVSYNFGDGSIFHKYCDSNSNSWHMNFIISTRDKEVILIESDTFGYVRVWDFNKGIMLKKLLIEKKMRLRGICLWNYRYFFVGAEDKKIKMIDLENNVEVDNLKCNDSVCTIKKINCSKYGECLVFQGKIDNCQIKLWRNENFK